jgi:hypothetical protein
MNHVEAFAMKKRSTAITLLSLCPVLAMGILGCGKDVSPPGADRVLVDEEVTVGVGGGLAEVSFPGTSGQSIRITLRGSRSMDPYGYLEYPDGEGTYTPENEKSKGGVNQSDVTLKQTGTYTLTVFDGTNQGGRVRVKVEVR